MSGPGKQNWAPDKQNMRSAALHRPDSSLTVAAMLATSLPKQRRNRVRALDRLLKPLPFLGVVEIVVLHRLFQLEPLAAVVKAAVAQRAVEASQDAAQGRVARAARRQLRVVLVEGRQAVVARAVHEREEALEVKLSAAPCALPLLDVAHDLLHGIGDLGRRKLGAKGVAELVWRNEPVSIGVEVSESTLSGFFENLAVVALQGRPVHLAGQELVHGDFPIVADVHDLQEVIDLALLEAVPEALQQLGHRGVVDSLAVAGALQVLLQGVESEVALGDRHLSGGRADSCHRGVQGGLQHLLHEGLEQGAAPEAALPVALDALDDLCLEALALGQEPVLDCAARQPGVLKQLLCRWALGRIPAAEVTMTSATVKSDNTLAQHVSTRLRSRRSRQATRLYFLYLFRAVFTKSLASSLTSSQ